MPVILFGAPIPDFPYLLFRKFPSLFLIDNLRVDVSEVHFRKKILLNKLIFNQLTYLLSV